MNLVVFQNKNMDYTRIVSSAVNMGSVYLTANQKLPKGTAGCYNSHPSSIRWSPPSSGFAKLNFDGLVINQQAALGFGD